MRLLILLFMSFVFAMPATAAESADSMKQDNKQVDDWNVFAKNLYKLHQKQIAKTDVKVTSENGGYRGKDFYNEKTYTEKKTGRVLSRIQWELDNPDLMHVIEVFVYDKQGRVTRDYTAAFLPVYRNAPVQTLIALHNYNGDLHAFRSFDASGIPTFERCQGSYQSKDVDMDFEDYEIDDMRLQKGGIMSTPIYQACFGKIDLTAKKYLTPN